MNHPASWSRRTFLGRAALASSAAVLWPHATLPLAGAELPALPVAVFSKVYQELKLNFEEAAGVTADAGLDGVDCPVRSGGEITPERAADDLPRYAEALRKQQRQVLLLTTGILGPDSPHTETILRTAKKLGIRYYRLGAGYHRTDQPLARQIAEVQARFKDLAAMNRELGVCGMLQNHSPGGRAYFGGNLAELYQIIAPFNPDQIGAAFDLGHALIVHGDEWPAHYERLRSHLKIAYVKDTRRGKGFVPFGEGEFGQTDFFTRLKRLGYENPFSIHIEFEWPKTRAGLVQALQASRRVLKEWLAKA